MEYLKEFINNELELHKANENYEDSERQNLVFFVLKNVFNYDVEEHTDYYLKATSVEAHMYTLNTVLPFIEQRNRETINISWSIEDVRGQAKNNGFKNLTDEQLKEILELINSNHDASIGVNWDTISHWANYYCEENDIK